MIQQIDIVEAHGWVGLYVGGWLVYQGHSIDDHDLLRLIDVNHTYHVALDGEDSKLVQRGGFPETLSGAENGFIDKGRTS
jgi:hypothetical protein